MRKADGYWLLANTGQELVSIGSRLTSSTENDFMTLEAGLLFSSGSVLGLSRAGEEQESRSMLTCDNI